MILTRDQVSALALSLQQLSTQAVLPRPVFQRAVPMLVTNRHSVPRTLATTLAQLCAALVVLRPSVTYM